MTRIIMIIMVTSTAGAAAVRHCQAGTVTPRRWPGTPGRTVTAGGGLGPGRPVPGIAGGLALA
jgi:hypothetical protein